MQKPHIPFLPSPQHRSAGFTLIELLFVIAIIALLAAILFPVFGRARENARRSSCQSNLKQFGVSMVMYSQDYDEYNVPVWTGPSAATPDPGSLSNNPWILNLQPYIKSPQILQCPSESKITGTLPPLRAWRNSLGIKALPLHYAYNYYLGGAPAYTGASYKPGQTFGIKTLAQIASPSETVMLADSASQAPWNDTPARPASTPPEDWEEVLTPEPSSGTGNDPSRSYSSYILVHAGKEGASGYTSVSNAYGTIRARHFNTANILWADGHVKAMRPSQVMEIASGASYANKPSSCFNPALGCSGGA